MNFTAMQIYCCNGCNNASYSWTRVSRKYIGG